MVEAVWYCSGCPFPCSDDYKTMMGLIKEVHDGSVSCGHELEKIKIADMSEEISLEIYLIGKENLQLHYENEVLKKRR